MTGPARIRIAIVGAQGRLGRFACEHFAADPGFDVVARLGRGDDIGARARASGAQIALETTVAGLGEEHALALLEHGVRPLVATSGVDEAACARLDRAAREVGLGGLVVPNFSLGMWLLQRAAAEAVRWFPHVEIVELHHERKRDAPSGTALDTRARLRAVRGAELDVPIHSVRLPGLYAHQEVLFGSPGELFTLRHDMSGPAAFGAGLVAGARYAARAEGVQRGIDVAFRALHG